MPLTATRNRSDAKSIGETRTHCEPSLHFLKYDDSVYATSSKRSTIVPRIVSECLEKDGARPLALPNSGLMIQIDHDQIQLPKGREAPSKGRYFNIKYIPDHALMKSHKLLTLDILAIALENCILDV